MDRLINDFFFGLPQMIANGLEPIGQFIFDAIIDGFNKAWHWVSKLWGGHSPSEVGLSIVEGITWCRRIDIEIFDFSIQKSLGILLKNYLRVKIVLETSNVANDHYS